MKRISFASIGFLLILGLAGNGFSEEAVTNRQILEKLNSMDVRIVRLETKVEEGQKSLQKQIDGLDKRIDGLQEIMIGGFGIIFAGIFALITFILWDS